jgi:hypothetical protein
MVRKSPNAHASATAIGTIAKGVDRASWIVTTTAAGVKRWSPVSAVGSSHKKYVVHDNGSRPFMVGYDKTHVSVFKLIQGVDEEEFQSLPLKSQLAMYSVRVLKPTAYVKAFVGKDPTMKGASFDGNSMLFDLGKNKYLFVGDKVCTMRPVSPIKEFVSPIGNSDVPYPYAVDDAGRSYLMNEGVVVPHADLAGQDPYSAFFAQKQQKKYQLDHPMKCTIVHGRI